MTVGIRWATIMTVQVENYVRKVFWMIESVELSMDAVASSSTRI
jgi:hypothetical protein